MAALFLIQENEVSLQLHSQRKSLSFTPVEITPEDRHQSLVSHLTTVDPWSFLDFVTPGMTPSTVVELLPDTLSDMDLSIERPQKLKVADGGEAGERGGW
jgi:hypothetical protein